MSHPIILSIEAGKPFLFAAASWLTGSMAGWLAFQIPVEKIYWYEQPAVVAGAVAAVTTILVTLINRHFQKQEKEIDAGKDREHQHTTFSEKMQELAQTQTQVSFTELTRLHEREVRVITENSEREVRFWKREYSIKSRGEFEGRIRGHLFANEADRLKSHIFILHKLMSDNKIPLPEFKEKSGDDIMNEVAAQMLTFKDDLMERYERAMSDSKG